MRRNLPRVASFSLFLALLIPWISQAALPTLPPAGKSAVDFVPPGWAILKQVEGDLNQDGKPDLALVLKNKAEDQKRGEEGLEELPRLLVILFQSPQGYNLSIASDQLVLCKICGGVYGDPFAGMKIAKGVLVIDTYAGSSHRWGSTDRWRFQDGDWFLIGRREFTEFTLGPEAKSTDTNFLTGAQIIESTNDLGQKKVEKKKLPKAPLQRLSTYKF